MKGKKMKVLDAEQSRPDFDMPAGSCDCHIHLFGSQSEYPSVADRLYTPPPIGLDLLSALQQALSLERAVVVQASVQGTDNSFLLSMLSKWPSRLRGVAVISDDIADAELQAMSRAGVRGVRLNFESHGIADPVLAGRRLAAVASKVAPHGLHVQMYVSAALTATLSDQIAALACPVVLDHFGRVRPSDGTDHPHFRTLASLLRSGKVYVKLSGPHRVSETSDYEDVGPLAAALFEANPDRMLWGSDWPHVLAFQQRNPDGPDPLRPEDDGANLNRLARWFAKRDHLKKILVDNPARLYGF
jgi:predicted TIM-barrel fold metal-dependent hydrolase